MRNAAFAIVIASVLATVAEAQTSSQPPRYNIPDLNKRATLLIRPAVSDQALFGELDGKTISLRVTVDADGNVESAQAPVNFSVEVRTAAETSAKESKFQPFVINGRTERYFGHLQYSFAYAKMDWFAFGTALESVHNFDNISVSPVAEKLTIRWAEEKLKLEAIDREKNIDDRIRSIAGMISHFRSKLEGREQWLFSTGVVVRNATFWGMVGGKIERNELQAALAKIASVTENVPPEIPKEFVDTLRQMSTYKVSSDTGERELRQEIMKLSMGLRNYPR